MIAAHSLSLPSRPRRSTLTALVLFAALLLSSCGQADSTLDSDVIRQFDINTNTIANLALDSAGEVVPRDELMQSVIRAQNAGTNLRVVVAAPDGEFVSAASVVDRYGGTAISYQADRAGFEGASKDLSSAQLDRAVGAAKLESTIGESAAAFVNVIATEGIDKRGRSLTRTALALLLIPAALFMLSGAWSYLQARKRRIKRQRSFAERKSVLIDWAAQLGPEVESLRGAVAASPDDTTKRKWHESQEFVAGVQPTLEAARTVGDLDMAEMRIGRTAIKLRDLRSSLES